MEQPIDVPSFSACYQLSNLTMLLYSSVFAPTIPILRLLHFCFVMVQIRLYRITLESKLPCHSVLDLLPESILSHFKGSDDFAGLLFAQLLNVPGYARTAP